MYSATVPLVILPCVQYSACTACVLSEDFQYVTVIIACVCVCVCRRFLLRRLSFRIDGGICVVRGLACVWRISSRLLVRRYCSKKCSCVSLGVIDVWVRCKATTSARSSLPIGLVLIWCLWSGCPRTRRCDYGTGGTSGEVTVACFRGSCMAWRGCVVNSRLFSVGTFLIVHRCGRAQLCVRVFALYEGHQAVASAAAVTVSAVAAPTAPRPELVRAVPRCYFA